MIKAPRGTYDVLPNKSHEWQNIERVMREKAALSGFKEIRTPTFEFTELFSRGVGGTTDVVQKEMYTFLDKGKRSITLKPEGTAGVVRAMLEAGLNQGVLPLKLYYLNAPIFRYEAPQSGRMREHHQFGVEMFGAELPTSDAEIIALALSVLTTLGITNVTLNINSIGCPDCREAYQAKLSAYLDERKDELCPTCNERLDRNPMRILDCKVRECQELLVDAPYPIDFLCDDCKAHFEGLKDALAAIDIPYMVNPKIVRGLDYYTNTVFELITDTESGKLTVCGGGRYNGLVEQLGGGSMPGVGFGMGMERLLMLLEKTDRKTYPQETFDVLCAPIFDKDRLAAFALANKLRANGVKAECDHVGRRLKAQFKYADKAYTHYVVIVGGEEAERGEATVRCLTSHFDQVMPLDKVVDAFTRMFGKIS